MADNDLVERVSIISECVFPEHTRSFADEESAGGFAAGLQENYLMVTARLAAGDTVVMTAMDPKHLEGIYPGPAR